MPNKWTAKEVRRRLPRVKVLWQGKEHTGYVSGRRLEEAIVWLRVGGETYERKYSFEAVARALNAGKPLYVGK